jgi:hypothetical protein
MEGLFSQKSRSGLSKRSLTRKSPQGLRKRIGNVWQAVKGATRRAKNRFLNFVNPTGHSARVRQGDKERRSARKAASAARSARVNAFTGKGKSLASAALEAHAESARNAAAALGRSASRTAQSAVTVVKSFFK